jgi:cation diffusion facilitator family transporter
VDRHKDHNLWSAYLHVMADAMTSVLAISALLAGKYFGQNWLDPFMGILGAALVVRWSIGLLRSSAGVLLDMQGPDAVRQAIRGAIEGTSGDRVSDLHVWAVGPGIYAAEIALVASAPKAPDDYAALLPRELPVVHVTVEVHRCPTPSP